MAIKSVSKKLRQIARERMKDKRVLVTGASGFLGKFLCRELEASGAILFKFSKPGILGNGIEGVDRGVYYVDDQSLDYIYHCAVRTQAGNYNQKYPANIIHDNIPMNQDILDYWLTRQTKAKFVTFGSSCGYSTSFARNEASYLSGTPEEDYWAYGWVKRMLYVSLKAYAHQHNLQYLHFIPCSLFGPEFKPYDLHLIPSLVKEVYASMILEQKHPILYGDGTQTRQALFIKDAAKAVVDFSQKYTNRSINLCPRISRSVIDYTRAICRSLNYDFNNVKYDMRQHKGMHRPDIIQNYKIYETPLQDAIDETADYYKESRGHKLN